MYFWLIGIHLGLTFDNYADLKSILKIHYIRANVNTVMVLVWSVWVCSHLRKLLMYCQN